MQARYVILRVLLEAGEKLVQLTRVTGSDGKPDVLISLDRTKIESVGRPAIGNFLRKLQVYYHLCWRAYLGGFLYYQLDFLCVTIQRRDQFLTYMWFALGIQVNGRSRFRKDSV